MATTCEVSALDWAFLCLEQDTAPMHVGAVAVFHPTEPVDPVRLAGLLAERAQRIARLRLRLAQSWLPGQAHWAEAPDFDAARHVHRHQVPSPGGREELAALVAELLADPLDRRRPLWELHLITGLDGDRFAVLVKFHHALADGRDAVEIGLGLLDGFAPGPAAEARPEVPRNPLGGALEMFRSPQQLVDTVRGTLSKSGESLVIASSVLRNMRVPMPDSPLRAASSMARRVALIPIDLADLRRIRARHGGTTNDVMLAVLAGALRRWLSARGHPVEDLPARALIPVCRRRGGNGTRGNNQLSGYLCDLPVGEPDPVARLRAIRASMGCNKSAGPLRGPGAFPVLAGRVPQIVHQVATPLAGQGAALLFDTVITNVPLPAFPAALAGAELAEVYPVAPLAVGHALAVAVSQFRDTVHVGVQANRAALPDLEKLSEALPLAVAELDDRS
ncbi:wax ester/triacylglycerol synthase family O-acyltransferase [Saccharopolyspora sp. K220]|uniref:wax ester/triacylglycerol synthase family O-acyltransferase n=1 Tax=Saccharopolyspora soli TaxID=2926618 RepID=UPI001F582C74|nr:wax ester/triacylglycerol synthase family O-acyltransferase [Saccharopolyspora soli]MCI2417586.1 wax ester/triacylglycerol synthase family O-acyltransferase [Saccharopolyspora soli]